MVKLLCKKCNEIAEEVVLPAYEYVEGVPLQNVKAFQCPKCKDNIFTEKQIAEVEKRTEQIKAHTFSFARKITISGRSLSINLPEDLVRHMRLRKGRKLRLLPLDDRRFLAEIS